MTCPIPAAELAAIHTLVDAGTPITAFAPRATFKQCGGAEFAFRSWKTARPSISRLRGWKPGYAVAAVTGESFDVIDVDPRNGGADTFAQLQHLLPDPVAIVDTPSDGGRHYYIPATGYPTVRYGGIDYLGKNHLVYLPPTQRPKYDGKGYLWVQPPRFNTRQIPDTAFVDALIALAAQQWTTAPPQLLTPRVPELRPTGELVDTYYLLSWAHSFVAKSPKGQRNTNLNRAAAYLGKNLGNEETVFALVVEQLMSACHKSGLLAEDGHQACLDTIKSGFSAGRRYKEVC